MCGNGDKIVILNNGPYRGRVIWNVRVVLGFSLVFAGLGGFYTWPAIVVPGVAERIPRQWW
jgi:hypothetical protein